MLSKIYSATLIGLQASKIEVEAESVQGKPVLTVIGLAEKALEEARERLTSALTACGVRLKCKKTLINLAPADLKKTGSNLELAMAMALFELTREKRVTRDNDIFFGELALDGSLRAIRGALPLVNFAKKCGFTRVFLPSVNVAEVEIVSGIQIFPVPNLQVLLGFLEGKMDLACVQPHQYVPDVAATTTDFADIVGQTVAKRCLEIAAAGGHNLLLSGVPGAGKSLLAQALPSILPPLTEEEALELTAIYSVAGLNQEQGLITMRPCRAPHHTISAIGLAGGGVNLMPGEMSLAHNGILFLDELAEFRRDALEIMRQPLETGIITIVRAHGRVTYPADVSLIAATNPCPCGYLGSKKRQCRCSRHEIERYQRKLSGPILDRLDMQIFVAEVEIDQLTQKQKQKAENSATVRARVVRARERQRERYANLGLKISTNHQLTSAQIREYLPLAPGARDLLRQAAGKWQLSARSYFKLIKVARTIADLAAVAAKEIPVAAVAESLQYRQTKTRDSEFLK